MSRRGRAEPRTGPAATEELGQLAAARSVIPGAETAALVAICPAGLKAGAAPDLSFDAEALLAAWDHS